MGNRRGRSHLALTAFVFLSLLGDTGAIAGMTEAAGTPPRNPFLADSEYPITHSNPSQVDSTATPGPTAPSHRLAADEVETALIGPGHFGNFVSGKYPNGHRVIWTNNPRDVVKLDYDTLRVLATYRLTDDPIFTETDAADIKRQLKAGGPGERLKYAASIVGRMLPSDLASAYTMLARDNTYFVGSSTGIAAYGDSIANDPTSPIVRKRSWTLPAEIPGTVVGVNMTYDGWIVLATDRGIVLTLSRDFTKYHFVWLPHSDEAPAYNARMAEQHRGGYNWIRNSLAVDAQGGIYVAANNWMEKLVWNGRDLSVDEQAGAWTAPYPNGTGTGTGATPVLLGFGTGDKLVVITDGDPLMRVTLFWRDHIPSGWTAPSTALSARVAGMLPVTMGDPKRQALQSEQAVVVAGWDMVVVNNEPASMPPGLPPAAKGLLISLLGDDPAYTPHGMEKFTWDPHAHRLAEAWTNTEVSSPNCVPYASLGSNRVYTVGFENGDWTLEAVRLDTGASAAAYALGDAGFNTMFSGIYVDAKGRIIYGGMFGSIRLAPAKP
jgi:hypothetical protein